MHSDLLARQSVAFLNFGAQHRKRDLELLVARLGGEVHQNPVLKGGNATRHLLASNLSNGTVKSLVGMYDVMC